METTVPEPSGADGGPPLRRALEVAGLGLASLVTLYALFTIGAGIAFQERQFKGDELHRIGLVAASAIDLRIGITLVVCAILAVACAHLPERDTGLTRPTCVMTLVGAALAVVLALLAIRAQYHQVDLRKATPTTAFHLSQAVYVVGTIGPAILAAALAAPVLGVGNRR